VPGNAISAPCTTSDRTAGRVEIQGPAACGWDKPRDLPLTSAPLAEAIRE